MSRGLLGRAIAMVGIIAGLLAVGLVLTSAGGATGRYLDGGATTVFAIILLSAASYLPAEVGFDTAGAAAGTAVFGFYLFVPGLFAFNRLGMLGAAAWLGLATVLIPIGWAVVRSGESEHAPPAAAADAAARLRDPQYALALAGLILVIVGIWLPFGSGSPSFWSGSSSGHALGLLLLIAAAANVVTLIGPLLRGMAISADATLLVACATFGLAAASWLQAAPNHLGSLESGGWIEAVGGLLLVGGVVATRLAPARRAPAASAAAATQ
jgi:hypothetical protein